MEDCFDCSKHAGEITSRSIINVFVGYTVQGAGHIMSRKAVLNQYE
ncbi:hypothetical protein V7654_07560 [Bacillus sp. JJ1609]